MMGLLPAALGIALAGAVGQSLPPVTERMLDRAAVVCLQLDDSGTVTGADIVTSSGDAGADADILAWTRGLHWPARAPGEPARSGWFPMAAVFGKAARPATPGACGPER